MRDNGVPGQFDELLPVRGVLTGELALKPWSCVRSMMGREGVPSRRECIEGAHSFPGTRWRVRATDGWGAGNIDVGRRMKEVV